jgi:hypothetical protein
VRLREDLDEARHCDHGPGGLAEHGGRGRVGSVVIR